MTIIKTEFVEIDYDRYNDAHWVANIYDVTYYIPVTNEFGLGKIKFLVDLLYWLVGDADEYSLELDRVELYHNVVRVIKLTDMEYFSRLVNPVSQHIRRVKTVGRHAKLFKLGGGCSMFTIHANRAMLIRKFAFTG